MSDEKKKQIKPQGTLKPTKGGTAHIPNRIRMELGYPKEIPFVADAHTVLLFNPKSSVEDILESLKVLAKDIRLRVIVQKEKLAGDV